MAALGIEETAEDKRLRAAACLLADIGWRAHPDYRGEQSLNIISNAAFVGVDHPGRAYLALAVYYRHAGLSDEELGAGIRELAPLRYREKRAGARRRFPGRLSRLGRGGGRAAAHDAAARRAEDRAGAAGRPRRPCAAPRLESRVRAVRGARRASRPGSSSRAEATRPRRAPGAARRPTAITPRGDMDSARSPRFSASACSPKSWRRQPFSAGTSASSSAAICSSSSVLAMMRAATPCSSATILRSTFRSSAAALACSGAARWRGICGSSLVGQRAAPRSTARQDAAREVGALEAARDGPEPPERLGVVRLLQGDLVDRLVLQHAAARHVAAPAPRARARRRAPA